MSTLLPRSEKRTLRYDFTAVEAFNLSKDLASKNKEIATLKKQKTSAVSQYTAKINEAEASCNDLSNKVADGYEHREVDCDVFFNQPDQGKKTIIRKDSNTLVGVEGMTKHDWDLLNEDNNLFNQNDKGQQDGTDQQQEEEDLLQGDNVQEGA
jgi:hypothetical protein